MSLFSEMSRCGLDISEETDEKVKGIMKKVVKVLRGMGYLIAFSLILYPVVLNYINQMNSTTIATDYEQEVSHLSEEQE